MANKRPGKAKSLPKGTKPAAKQERPAKRDLTFYESLASAAATPLKLAELIGDEESWKRRLHQIGQTAKKHSGRLHQLVMQAQATWTRQTKPWLAEQAWPWLKFEAKLMRGDASALVPLAGAALQDVGSRTLAVYQILTGRTARRIYQLALALGAVTIVVGGSLIASTTYALYANDLASPTALMAAKSTGTTILDRNGQVLYQVYGANNRKLVELNQVPQNMTNATLAAEDPDFYHHDGVSLRGTARAVYEDLANRGKVQGGSTITQQLVKNALLSPDKTFSRKFQEIVLSTELERRYSKDEILQMYLNEIYYGQGSYGIESASQTYFHKTAKELSNGQAAMLAGLPLCPGACDPVLHPDVAQARRDYVLDRMGELGYLTADQVTAAKAEPLVAYAQQITIHAPHFVFYVLDQLRAQYGDDAVERGGITVYTTLDLTKQNEAEKDVKAQITRLAGHHATNGGLVSLDPKTGEIQAMVGSVDYNAPGFGNVNVTTADLQPGSSFKPFCYSQAFKKGWNGATTVDDLPISLPDGPGQTYTPKDYDGKWRGKNIRLRRALANSLNIPAIHVIQFTGVQGCIDNAKNLGITTLGDSSRYGVSLVLGGGEVHMVDMAAAYGTFANGGLRVQPKAILKVVDRHQKDITKAPSSTPQQVLDPRIAYMITDILSDNQARTEEFGANSPLHLSHIAAAKTGTTNDFRDNWTVGYTPDVVTAVWVGNNDHSAMSNVDGITGAAPIWHDYMEYAVRGTSNKAFPVPSGIVRTSVCAADGGLANPWDTSLISEVFLTEAVPTKHCSTAATPPPAPPQPAGQPAQPDATPAPDKKTDKNGGPGGTTNPGGTGGSPVPPSPIFH